MPRRAPALILTFLIAGFAGACSRQQPTATADEAFEVLTTSWDEAETNEQKTVLAEGYLARFPDTGNSSRMADAVAYYRGHAMEDPEGAYEVIRRSRTRKALALAYDGWASYHLGNTEEAFAAFAEADAAKSLSYLGVPDTPLYRFWGRAALRENDPDTAIGLLGADAIFGEDDAALPYFQEAYLAKNGSADGFDEFLWKTRKRLARSIDDFELPDYTGTVHSLSAVGDKVLLLAFWFPT